MPLDDGLLPAGTAPTRRRLGPAERMPQILDAALAEFAERGFAGASMAAAASRAGIAKGLIYHYFPGKAALFKAVVRSCVQPAFSEAERRVATHPGPRADLLRDLIGFGYGRIAADSRESVLFRLLVAEAQRFPELGAFYHAEVLSRGLGLVGQVIRAGVATGEFRADAAAEAGLAPVLMAPVAMASVWRIMVGEAAPPLEAMRDAHIALVLRGLAAR